MNKYSKKVSKYSSSKTKNKNTNTNHTKKQLGAGLFSITPKKYTNIKYGKSGNVTPKLICLQCTNEVFRHHQPVMDSRLRAALLGKNAQLFGQKYNAFVCYKCGFMMNYSGDITYDGEK